MPRHICWVFISLLLLSGCEPRAAHPGAERPKEFAVSASEDTSLRREIAPDTAEHKGRSGFRLIATGKDAFLTRIAMVRMAERGVDMQYYSVNNDRTAQALLRELVLVADRGVRVRVLIDGLNIGKIDEIASMMHAHPHMEIRVFNPLTTVHKPFWTHVTHYVTEFDRFSKRMHNKTLIVDNQVAVLGGRNISDHYFDASGDFNFNDMDVITAGPITSQISRSFDAYWNSAETYTYDEITKSVPDKEEIQEVRHELDEKWESVMQTSFGPILKDLKPLDYLGKGKPLTWAPMELAVDRPDKINQEQEEADSAPFQRLETLLDGATDAGDTALRGPRRRSRAVDLPASQAQRIVRRHLGGSALDILV